MIESNFIFSYKADKTTFSSKENKLVVAEAVEEGIDGKDVRKVIKNLKLPDDLPTSNSSFCKVVQVEYVLGVKIHKEKVHLPITISLVPMSQTSK
jgi:hypothetical protein